jgi:hypothetical protein
MTRPIWMIEGLPYCGIHMIQIPKLMKCSMECRVCFAPWVKLKNCRRHVAEVFRIWSSKDGYGKSLWTLIKLIKKRIGIIQGGDLKFCLKLYGHIAYLGMVLGVETMPPCEWGAASLAKGHQVEKVLIELSKWYLTILICWRCCKLIVSQEQLKGGAWKGTF